ERRRCFGIVLDRVRLGRGRRCLLRGGWRRRALRIGLVADATRVRMEQPANPPELDGERVVVGLEPTRALHLRIAYGHADAPPTGPTVTLRSETCGKATTGAGSIMTAEARYTVDSRYLVWKVLHSRNSSSVPSDIGTSLMRSPCRCSSLVGNAAWSS